MARPQPEHYAYGSSSPAFGANIGAGLGGAVAGGAMGAVGGGAFTAAPAPYPPAPDRLYPVRGFSRAKDIPPRGIGAYGVVALRSLPTSASMDRLQRVCASFLSSLPPESSLPAAIAIRDRMVTVWPITQPGAPQVARGDCDFITQNYDLFGGIAAIQDARSQSLPMTGRGPFLIGWSPSTTRGVKDAVVLVIDMSTFESQASFDEAFQFWQRKVVEDPNLWRRGFSVEGIKLAVRDFADHYGQEILDGLNFWKDAKKTETE